GSSSEKDARMRETAVVANSEWPPSSKKLSWIPTCETRNTSDQISANTFSVSVRGATNSLSKSGRLPSGAGNAFRSSFPFAVNGNSANGTNTDGIMYSGKCALRYRLNSLVEICAPSSVTTYATN